MKIVRFVGIDHPIYLAIFDNNYQKCMSFVRLQECYESPCPRFYHCRFTLEDFMAWYVENQASQKGLFTYPNDWEGFNVPGYIVEFFRTDPNHSRFELELLEKLDAARQRYGDVKGRNYYLIGSTWDDKSTMRHELRHGLFYCDKEYRKKALRIIRQHSLKSFRKNLRNDGYNAHVVEDEINAYATTGWRRRTKPTQEMLTVRKKLRMMEKEHKVPFKVELDMRVVIAGSRTITNYMAVVKAIKESKFDISEVVSGTAKGVDSLGEYWALQNGVPVKRFPPNWKSHGRAAGVIRNNEMAEYADAVIVIWDGNSRGSKHMIDAARKAGCLVYEQIERQV